MKKLLYVSLFTGLLLITPSSHAIVYQVTRWWHPELQQEVNILSDIHLDAGDYCVTSDQRIDIVEREAISFRIVEDTTEYYKFVQDPKIRQKYKDLCTKSSLIGGGFYQKRYYDYIEIVPIDSNENLNKLLHRPSQSTSILGLHLLNNTANVEFRYHDEATTQKVIKEVSAYNDNPILNAYYQRALKNDDDNDLLNARVLHTLYQNSDKRIIDIIIGGAHGDAIEPVIEQLGYQKIRSIGSNPVVQRRLYSVPTSTPNSSKKESKSILVVPAVAIQKTLAEPLALQFQKPIKSKL